MPKNQSKNKKREFIDKEHSVMTQYYDLLEAKEHYDDDVLELIDKDPDFYEPYLYLAHLWRDEDGDEKTARELEDDAFQRALKRITDKKGNWPDEMHWGFLENRHIIRALATGADNLWQDGKLKQALDVYRKLLHSNLNDNIGARYSITALRIGMSYKEYMQKVWPQHSMPSQHVDGWFDKNAPAFAGEFQEWKRYCIDTIGISKKDLPI